MLYYIVAARSDTKRVGQQSAQHKKSRSREADRERKRVARASAGKPYSPNFTSWFKQRVAETAWSGDYVWDRQLAAAIKDGSESDRSLRRYYDDESKKPRAPLAYTIGWAFHELGLEWCSGPVTLLAAGHAAEFFKLLAVLSSYGAVEREAALILALGSFRANSLVGGPDVGGPSSNARYKRFGLMRAAISVRKDARNAVGSAAQRRASIDRAWNDSMKSGTLHKAQAVFRYAYETVSRVAPLSQGVRIAGALIMIAAFIEAQGSNREQEILEALHLLSPTQTLHALLSMEPAT
jgi:hypothetical protein